MSDADYPDSSDGDQASLAGYDGDQATLGDATAEDDDECLCERVDDDRLGCFDHYEVTDP